MIDYLRKISSSWWGMLLISSVPFLIILAPILFASRIFFNSDLVTCVYPNYYFYHNALINGESFFWNFNNFSGFPIFIGSMGFLSPLHYLFFRLFSFFTANNLIIFLNLTLALFFTWRLLVKFGLSFWVGFAGGLIYVFCQWQWVSSIAIASALPILPLLFLLIFKLQKNNLLILFSGLLIGYGFLSMHFNWLAMILSAGFLFSIFLGWSDMKRWLLPIKFLLSCIIGAIIGFPIILPILKYSALSSRAIGLSYKAASTGMFGLGDFLRYFLPYFNLSIFNLAISPTRLYLGILPLFFLFFSLKLKLPFVRFFAFLFFICLLIGIGYSPFFWVLHKLPIFNSFRGPDRWMFIGSFAASILSSFGIQYFWIENNKWKKTLLKTLKWISYIFLIFLIILNLIFYFLKNKFIFLAKNYFDKYLYAQTSGLPIAHYHKYIEIIFHEIEQLFNILNPKVFLPVVFIFVSYFILNAFYKKRINPKYFLKIITLVIFLNFCFVLAFYHTTTASEVFFRQPETVRFLKTKQSSRIFSFLPGFSEYNKLAIPYHPKGSESFIFQSEMIIPNLNILYGLDSVNYYDNLMHRPMSRIMALIGSDRAVIGEKLSDLKITPQEKVEKLEERKKFLDFLGVRYIISAFPLNEQKFDKIFETLVQPYNIPISIYENKQARSLFYFADKVKMIEPNEEKAYQKLLESSLEEKNIFIECLDCPKNLAFDGKSDIIINNKENAFVSLKTESENNQILVFSENYLPGWKAYLDNQEISIYMANTVYMSILVPKGEHEIVFKYNPYNYEN